MKLFGLTGGVGMGKSTAAGFLLAQGVRVIDTDEIAHRLVRSGQPALAEIRQEFGKNILTTTGELNRAELARLVFGDVHARKKLEAILHPRIRENWLSQVELWHRDNCLLAVVVIPLLFETQAEACFQKIICVACSAAAQHERLTDRGWSSEQIAQRRAAQWPVDQKIACAHHVLWSEGTPAAHEAQVAQILERI